MRPSQAALRVPVRGEVTLDGVPLSQGRIMFECREGAELVLATASVTDGRFELPATIGPSAGKNVVRIESAEIEDVEAVALARSGKPLKIERVDIPARYNQETELQAELQVDGPNTLRFELNSKPDVRQRASKTDG